MTSMEKISSKLPRSVEDEGVGSYEHPNSDENERTHTKEQKKAYVEGLTMGPASQAQELVRRRIIVPDAGHPVPR